MATGTIAPRKGREGSRWFNERPSGEDVAAWFKDVPLHDGLSHDRYVGGVVLIEQELKAKEIRGFNENTGAPIISEGLVTHLTFTPYPKVESRVLYFADLMLQHPEWMGVIEPVAGDEGLPPGFTIRTIAHPDRSGNPAQTRFVCSTIQVRVFVRDTVKETIRENRRTGHVTVLRTGETVIAPPPATKMSPILNRYGNGAEPFSLMKAETGAIGRALGMAGMLVVPGAGVATAEDMIEAEALDGRRVPSEPEQTPEAAASLPAGDAPAQEDEEASLRAQATTAIEKLKTDHPEAFVRFKEWSDEKGYKTVADTNLIQLKGLVKKAEKDLDNAIAAAAKSEEPTDG